MQKRSTLLLGMAAIAFSPLLAEADASYLLQLGSFPTEAAASERWNSLKGEFNDQLEGLEMHISNVAIGGGKSIYRLQAGPMNSKDTASSRCAALKAAKQDCYLVETAVLSNEAPKQALSAVRATASNADAELQFGKEEGDTEGLITLDTAMPRVKESAGTKPVASSELTEATPSVKANTPEVISPDKAPPSPLESSLTEDLKMESTASVPPLPEPIPGDKPLFDDVPSLADAGKSLEAPALDAPEAAAAPIVAEAPKHAAPAVHYAPEKTAKAAAAPKANSDALQSLAAHPETTTQADDAKSIIAPANSPMGSLGTLRLNPQGEVVGSSAPLAQTIAAAAAPAPAAISSAVPVSKTAPAPQTMVAPAAAPRPVSIAATPSPTAASIAAPASIALLAPPAPSIGASDAPASVPNFVTAPAAPVAAPLASSNGTLQLPANRNGQVLVKEAVRVRESTQPVDPLTPPTAAYAAAPAGQQQAMAQQAQAPQYTAPAEWRGTPSSSANGMVWAQFGKFADEQNAFAFFDNLRAQRPDLTNAVRVRALHPYSAYGSRKVTLRVGPYRSENEVNALCALLAQQGMPCDSIRENGPSFNAGGPRQADMALNRPNAAPDAKPANPFVAPGNHWVQIGTFGSDTEAYNRFSTLKAGYPKLFGSMQPNVTQPKSNSSSRPAHRLRVGPFMDDVAARGFCTSLGQNGIPCLLVKQ